MNTSTADVNLGIDLHLPMKLRPARTAVPENSVDANIDAKQQADSARPRTEILSDHVTAPRFGLSNPTKVDNPFWKSILIGKHLTSNTDRKCRAVVEANSLPTNLGSSKKDSATDTSSTPAPPQRFTINWCSSRSGQTRTRLPDGRSILIGGIHADSPHGKCVIFNDVTVLHDRPADDDQQFFPPPIKPEDIEVYTYPKAAFPPVYGHTATYVHTEGGHEQIYIFGGIGDDRSSSRRQRTLVHVLDLETFEIEHLSTSAYEARIDEVPTVDTGNSQTFYIKTATRTRVNKSGDCIAFKGGVLHRWVFCLGEDYWYDLDRYEKRRNRMAMARKMNKDRAREGKRLVNEREMRMPDGEKELREHMLA